MNRDISRCTGKDCPFRDTCMRYTDVISGEIYSYFDPPVIVTQGKECDYFIPAIKYKNQCQPNSTIKERK